VVLKVFAAASSRLDGLHLHLLGIGVLESALRHQVEELGISCSVTFHGHVEHDLLPAYYRGASFCVLGSHFESQGMVILEAAACGRATIGSAVGSMPSFCPEQFLCHPGNDDELAAMIVKVAGNPQLAERLADFRFTVRSGCRSTPVLVCASSYTIESAPPSAPDCAYSQSQDYRGFQTADVVLQAGQCRKKRRRI
jgi:glycosyltransferase involved in cell wall biosynthesis